MSKRWRRAASVTPGATGSAPVAPIILSVITRDDLSQTDVTFDQPVTWNGVDPGTFILGDPGGNWISQESPTVLGFSVAPGNPTPWSWDGPDASLTPTPSPSQTGSSTVA